MKVISFLLVLIAQLAMILLCLRLLSAYYAEQLEDNFVVTRIHDYSQILVKPFAFLSSNRIDMPALAMMLLLAFFVALLKGGFQPLSMILLTFYEALTAYLDVLVYAIIFVVMFQAMTPPGSQHPAYDLALAISDYLLTPLHRFLPANKGFDWSYLVALILIVVVRFMLNGFITDALK